LILINNHTIHGNLPTGLLTQRPPTPTHGSAAVSTCLDNTELEPTAPRVTPIKDKIDQVLLVRELLLY
jgi:hypothetical protein